jgi:hypothetical protein
MGRRTRAPVRDGGTRCLQAPTRLLRIGRYPWRVTALDAQSTRPRTPRRGRRTTVGRRGAVALGALFVIAILVGGAFWVVLGPSTPSCEAQRSGFDTTLERQVPTGLEGRGPDRLDSGRHCTSASLGTLAERHGLGSVDFAGGLWDLAPSTGVTLAVFRAPGLQAEWIAEFYETGAQHASKVESFTVTHPTIAGTAATRFDYSDAGQPQAIVVWPSPQPGLVRVVLAAGVPDRVVQEAIAAFG